MKKALTSCWACVFINRNFTFLWLGQAVSQVGDYLFDTTLTLWVATILLPGSFWAPLAVSGTLLAASIPALIIQPIAGVYVDRWNKRQTMIRMDVVRAILVFLLLLLAVSTASLKGLHLSPVWVLGSIYVIVFASSTCAQFFNPSTYTLLGDIVPEAHRTKAFGLNQVVASLASIIGPSLAGILVFSVGVQWTLLLNTLSFAVSFLSISAIQVFEPDQQEHTHRESAFFQELREGIQFLLGSPLLRAMMVSVNLNMLGYGMIGALNVFFVTRNLHAPASLYGFLGAGAGVGAVGGSAFAHRLAQRFGQIKVSWLAMVMMGICILLFARQTNFLGALITFALFGGANATCIVAMEPLTLGAVPRELVGRVSSVIVTSWSVTLMISTACAGYLASILPENVHISFFGFIFGSIDSILTGAGTCLFISGIYFMVNLRSVAQPKRAALKEPTEIFEMSKRRS